jgi:hypothetical protein
MHNKNCCRTCADFDKGICVGALSNLDFDEGEMKGRMRKVLTGWLSWDFAGDIADTAIESLENHLAFKIEDPDEFYCAKWR